MKAINEILHGVNLRSVDKRKVGIITAIIVLCATFLLLVLYLTNLFFERYHFVFHFPIEIKFFAPVKVEARQPKIEIKEVIKEATQSAKPIEAVEAAETVLRGEASYYSFAGCLGCDEKRIMANGEQLDDTKFTVALPPHVVNKHKLINKNVKVTNTKNNQVAIAKVTDTGGFYELTGGKRVADLSVAVKEALGCGSICQVEVSY